MHGQGKLPLCPDRAKRNSTPPNPRRCDAPAKQVRDKAQHVPRNMQPGKGDKHAS
jgi:hypothetical protein